MRMILNCNSPAAELPGNRQQNWEFGGLYAHRLQSLGLFTQEINSKLRLLTLPARGPTLCPCSPLSRFAL